MTILFKDQMYRVQGNSPFILLPNSVLLGLDKRTGKYIRLLFTKLPEKPARAIPIKDLPI